MDYDNIYCPECGGPNVAFYEEYSCVWDCDFEFYIDD